MTLPTTWVTGQTFTAADADNVAAAVNANTVAIAALYTKPGSGIPKTDLAAAVQTSLGLADSSVQALPAVPVAYAATVTPNADTTRVLNVGALTGNLTLANPIGTPVDGQLLRIRFVQDATGGRTITFGSEYLFGTDVTAALIPTTASANWEMLFERHAATTKWRVMSIARGF